jgi:hypothetical protein
MTALFALLASTLASAEPSTAPSIALLPLLGEEGITAAEAAGVTAQLRARLDHAGDAAPLRRLSTTARDDDERRRCAEDAACYAALAEARGADFVAWGAVSVDDEGFRARVAIVGPRDSAPRRTATAVLRGDDGDGARIDRLWRALADRELPPVPSGAAAEPSGDGAIGSVGGSTAMRDDANALPVALLGAGAGVIAAGALAGGGALWLSVAVEERARDQQLVFPRDAPLLFWGNTLAWTANILLAGGLASAGTGGALLAWQTSKEPS